jgi:hypothetical protein
MLGVVPPPNPRLAHNSIRFAPARTALCVAVVRKAKIDVNEEYEHCRRLNRVNADFQDQYVIHSVQLCVLWTLYGFLPLGKN